MPRILPFEEHREEYEQWFVLNRFAYQSELDAVRQLLPEGKGLEIGVGSGLFAAPLGIEFGVEPSPKMLELAKQRGIKVIRGIGEQLPVRNASLDFALMVTTVCFLDNVMQGFREAQRILKPGGHFLVGFIDRETPLGQEYQRFKNQSVFYRDAEFYSVQELLDYLSRAGFGHFAFRQTIFHFLSEITTPETVKSGWGEGSFVVIDAVKKKERES